MRNDNRQPLSGVACAAPFPSKVSLRPPLPPAALVSGVSGGRVLEAYAVVADLTLLPVDGKLPRICMGLTGREASATGLLVWEGPGARQGPVPRLPGRLLKESPGILLLQRPRRLRERARKLRCGQGGYGSGQGSYASMFLVDKYAITVK